MAGGAQAGDRLEQSILYYRFARASRIVYKDLPVRAGARSAAVRVAQACPGAGLLPFLL